MKCLDMVVLATAYIGIVKVVIACIKYIYPYINIDIYVNIDMRLIMTTFNICERPIFGVGVSDRTVEKL